MRNQVTHKISEISVNQFHYFVFHCDACEKPWRSFTGMMTNSKMDFSVWDSTRSSVYEVASAEAEAHYHHCPEGSCMICEECLSKVQKGLPCADCAIRSMPQKEQLHDEDEALLEQDNSIGESFDDVPQGETTSLVSTWYTQRPNKSTLLIAACVIFVCLGLGLWFTAGSNETMDIADLDVPLGSFSVTRVPFPMETKVLPYAGDRLPMHGEEKYQVQDMDGQSVSVVESVASMTLVNPESNVCYLLFELILPGQGGSVFSSGLVEPGWCIEKLTLNQVLDEGQQEAELIVYLCSFDGFTILREEKAQITLVVAQ